MAEAPQVDVMSGGAVVWPDQPGGKAAGGRPASEPKTAAAPTPATAPNPLGEASAGAAATEQRRQPVKTAPPPLDPLAGVANPPCPQKKSEGVAYGKEWRGNRDKPARGSDGSIVYMFGATLPSIVCAPLYVCDLVLQPGETVKTINVGDSVRWQITAAEQGAGDALITHVIIKPTDVGLLTNMVITTDRRAYVVKLLSRADDWMPMVTFDYPDASRASWSVYRAQRAAEQEARDAEKAAAPEPAGPIDDGYRLSGDRPRWRPQRVYTDGVKTFVEFHEDVANGELPALVTTADDPSFLQLESLFNGPQRQLVNYRKDGNRFVVDKVLDKAALVMGVGSQATVVEIEHVGRFR